MALQLYKMCAGAWEVRKMGRKRVGNPSADRLYAREISGYAQKSGLYARKPSCYAPEHVTFAPKPQSYAPLAICHPK